MCKKKYISFFFVIYIFILKYKMMSQKTDYIEDNVNELQNLKYIGPVKADGKPDKRSREWKQYTKKRKELESKIEVKEYLQKESQKLSKNIINNTILEDIKTEETEKEEQLEEENQHSGETGEVEQLEEENQHSGETGEVEQLEEENQHDGETEEVEQLEEEKQHDGETEEVEQLEEENQPDGETEEVEQLEEEKQPDGDTEEVEQLEEESQHGGETRKIENLEGNSTDELNNILPDSGSIDGQSNDKNTKSVKDKIIKLFLETPRKEFLKLIGSVDNENFGLLLSQILEDYLSLSNKRKNEQEKLKENIQELESENRNLRKQFIKYCFPKVLTTKFSSLELSNNNISFHISNKWQLIDKDNLKYIKMKNQDLIKEWKEIFNSEPYITIMHETENKKQRVFILNKASLSIDNSTDKITMSYQQGMVQHERNKPLTDISESYNIGSGIVCIHT